MPAGAVVVVGSVNADLVVRVRELPAPGETVTGGVFARHGGGKGGNQAVAAARLGASVRFVGAVGADDLGEEALGLLAGEGVDVSGAARLADVPTGVAVIVVDERGENQIAVASGANGALTAAHVSDALALAGRGVVLLGHEVPPEVVSEGVRAARDAGWTAILNPAPARELIDDLAGVILTPNADEARRLAGEGDVEAAANALAERTRAPVLVTLGADGALLVRDGTAERIPAPRVQVVDTTGAGDTVNGALAADLAAGRELGGAARFALAAAALSTRVAGAREGMPRRDEVERSESATGRDEVA
jgi:ribokinase